MFRKVLLMALLGVCYGSIFEQSLKFSPLRKGVHRFAMDASKEAKKFDFQSSPTRLESEVNGNQGGLLAKLRTALLLHGQPVNGKSLLSLFGVRRQGQETGQSRAVTLQDYSIANCTSKPADKSLFVIDRLIVQPDPLSMPGVVNFAFTINILKDILTLTVDLDFRKKMGSEYIKIPCIGEFGSCSYPVCDLLKQVTSCPAKLQTDKIPCKCPFQKGMYIEPGFAADIEGAVFPPGDYEVTANMTDKDGDKDTFVGCYKVKFTFE